MLLAGCSGEAVPADFIGTWRFTEGRTSAGSDKTGAQFTLIASASDDFELAMHFDDVVDICSSKFRIDGSTASASGETCTETVGGSGCQFVKADLTRSPFTLTLRDDGTLAIAEHWAGHVPAGACYVVPTAGDLTGTATKQ